jgi:hypothetical protein
MRDGRRLHDEEGVTTAAERFSADLERLPDGARSLTSPEPPTVSVSPRLRALQQQVRAAAG